VLIRAYIAVIVDEKLIGFTPIL